MSFNVGVAIHATVAVAPISFVGLSVHNAKSDSPTAMLIAIELKFSSDERCGFNRNIAPVSPVILLSLHHNHNKAFWKYMSRIKVDTQTQESYHDK